jgi:hypothetical protein
MIVKVSVVLAAEEEGVLPVKNKGDIHVWISPFVLDLYEWMRKFWHVSICYRFVTKLLCYRYYSLHSARFLHVSESYWY